MPLHPEPGSKDATKSTAAPKELKLCGVAVKALINGEVRYIRVTANALKKGLVTKAPKRTWKKDTAKAKA